MIERFRTMVRIFFRCLEQTAPEHAEKSSQTQPSPAERLNNAFLALLTDPDDRAAREIFESFKQEPEWKQAAAFFEKGLEVIPPEIERHAAENDGFLKAIIRLSRHEPEEVCSDDERSSAYLQEVRNIFFPEGAGLENEEERGRRTAELRAKRLITVKELNAQPIDDPVNELLFTSNVLLTTPLCEPGQNGCDAVIKEKQQYWYDHPIPLGIDTDKNEAVYGLKGLDRMIEKEKEWGNVPADAKITCVLSLSVTHTGLHDIAQKYFAEELEKSGPYPHLDVYMITESDCERLLDEVLIPAARQWIQESVTADTIEGLKTVFGVDGEYGRHYSFLKAVAALWQVCIDPKVRATFKIDLDQVFPQDELKRETGLTALEQFSTPLWGAQGVDSKGRPVELGMIAGALVNQDDITHSLFSPDVLFPAGTERAEQYVFFSTLPQALSTEAEMMTRYDDRLVGMDGNEEKRLDGTKYVLQRVHVTGGTNGILIDSLRRHRPFTPSVIGRAEDQAYLLSVLYSSRSALRYLHKPGLIMRHDKHGFASEAIEKAAVQREVGDFIRMILFSFYARSLPWDEEEIKDGVDPFTGCFISYIPFTVVYLRFSAKLTDLCGSGEKEKAAVLAKEGGKRLLDAVTRFSAARGNPLAAVYQEEKESWNLYHDVLDRLEAESAFGSISAVDLRRRGREIIESCRITK